MTIAEQIIALRKRRKITQLQCAEKLGCTITHYGFLERKDRLKPKDLYKLAELLQFTIEIKF